MTKITDVIPHELREVEISINDKFELHVSYFVNGFFAYDCNKKIDVLSWLANHTGIRIRLPNDKFVEDKLNF